MLTEGLYEIARLVAATAVGAVEEVGSGGAARYLCFNLHSLGHL